MRVELFPAAGGTELGLGTPSHRKITDSRYYFGIPQSECNAILYVLDCSGSMNGWPMNLSKRAMRRALKNLNSDDTFQIIRFSNRGSCVAVSARTWRKCSAISSTTRSSSPPKTAR